MLKRLALDPNLSILLQLYGANFRELKLYRKYVALIKRPWTLNQWANTLHDINWCVCVDIFGSDISHRIRYFMGLSCFVIWEKSKLMLFIRAIIVIAINQYIEITKISYNTQP